MQRRGRESRLDSKVANTINKLILCPSNLTFTILMHKLDSTFPNCFLSDQISGLFMLQYVIYVFFLTFTASNCGQQWHAYKSGCLRLFQDHKNWVDANQHCATFNINTSGGGNGRLISIFSQDENNLIVNLRSSQGFSEGMVSCNYLRVQSIFLFFFDFVIGACNDNVICKKIELRAMSLQVQTYLDRI